MNIKFGELRKFVSRVDAISIMLKSIGDVDDNYVTIDNTPDKYDNYDVIGFGHVDCVSVDDIDIPLNGVEFYLDDTK